MTSKVEKTQLNPTISWSTLNEREETVFDSEKLLDYSKDGLPTADTKECIIH